MSLNKLLGKKELKGSIPDVLLPEISSPILQVENDAEEFTSVEIDFQNEIQEWESLLSRIEEDLLDSVEVPSYLNEDITVITPAILKDFLYTGNTLWPDFVLAYEEHHFSNGNSLGGMLYGTVLEVTQELRDSLDFLANSVQRKNVLPRKEIVEEKKKELEKNRDLRSRIEAALEKAKKRLPECYIRKIVRLIGRSGNRRVGGSTTSTLGNSKKELIDFIRAARLIIRYSIINNKINWKNTRKNVLNRFLQRAANRFLTELSSKLGELNSIITEPIQELLFQVIDTLSDDNQCDAYNDLIQIITEEFNKIRFDYISKLNELEQYINNKYQYRLQLVETSSVNLEMNKQLSTLDLILEGLETVLSGGQLEEEVVQYVKNKALPKLPNKGK